MTDNMLELKKDSLRQMQTGDIKLGFTIQHNDMPDYLFSDPMGKRYYVVFMDADNYDEAEGGDNEKHTDFHTANTPIYTQDKTVVSKTENTEGDRIRVRAIMLCKDELFHTWLNTVVPHDFRNMESFSRDHICTKCNILSRKKLTTNKDAQEKFQKLDQQFKDWSRYKDNLSREA